MSGKAVTLKFRIALSAIVVVGLSVAVIAAPSLELELAKRAYRSGDHETARIKMLPLAERGNPVAQHFIGAFYDHGLGIDVDDEQAVKWYTLAADQGFKNAQYALGSMYENGEGVEKNIAKAAMWFAPAAEQDHVASQRILGMLFLKGEGVDQSDTLARKWTTLAAEQGSASAQQNLSIMYYRGDAVPQSNRHSYMWATIGLANGSVSGSKRLVHLKESMTASEIASAEELAAACRSKDFKDC